MATAYLTQVWWCHPVLRILTDASCLLNNKDLQAAIRLLAFRIPQICGCADMQHIFSCAHMQHICGCAHMQHICGCADMQHICGCADMQHICSCADMQHICSCADMQHICVCADMQHICSCADMQNVCNCADMQHICSCSHMQHICVCEDMQHICSCADMQNVCNKSLKNPPQIRITWVASCEWVWQIRPDFFSLLSPRMLQSVRRHSAIVLTVTTDGTWEIFKLNHKWLGVAEYQLNLVAISAG